ncbi:MAG TPA: glycosyltransferase family 1 protein, partial [Thermoprotei archaeon]|nr:glycosyltransferase family 1 protein [Thermoprotei archaeon]
IRRVYHKPSSTLFMRIINSIRTQFMILNNLILLSNKVNTFIFLIGGEGLLIPILALKILKKNVVMMLGGGAINVFSIRKDPLYKFMVVLYNINLALVDNIIVYTTVLIKKLKLFKYRYKVIVAHRHFVDFTKFMIKKRITERSNLIGYIGRLSKEKGVLNLIKAFSIVLRYKGDVQLIICGKGDLEKEIKKIIRINGMEKQVKLAGWVPHDEIPRYLNEFKLVILPSFTETLPNVIVEAMACGTPVLATPVGSIPEIIRDYKTGFLLKSNDPKDIADKIIELLNNPTLLEKVSINAYKYAQKNFSEESVREIWRKLFLKLNILN